MRWASLLLAFMLLLSVYPVEALQRCENDTLSPQEVRGLWDHIYTEDGIFTANKVSDRLPSDKNSDFPEMKRESVIVTDESGTFQKEVPLPDQYIPADLRTLLVQGYAQGKYSVGLVLNSTFRLGIGKYLFGDLLRHTTDSIADSGIQEVLAKPVDEFSRPLQEWLKTRDPVVNAMFSDNFTVAAGCLGDDCHILTYSGVSKYFTTGRSAFTLGEMFVSMGGQYLYDKSGRFRNLVNRVRTKVASFRASPGDSLRNFLSRGQAPDAMGALEAQFQKLNSLEDDQLKTVLLAFHRKDALNTQEVRTAVGELEQAYHQVRLQLLQAGANPDAASESAARILESVANSGTLPQNMPVMLTEEQIQQVRTLWGRLDSVGFDNDQLRALLKLGRQNYLNELEEIIKEKGNQQFLTFSPYWYYMAGTRHAIASSKNMVAKGVTLLSSIAGVLPTAYVLSPEGFFFGRVLGPVYSVPTSWTKIIIKPGPLEDPVYREAYVDFFSNTGSDTGNLFVDFIELWPGLLYTSIKNAIPEEGREVLGRLESSARKWFPEFLGRASRVDDIGVLVATTGRCEGCTLATPPGMTVLTSREPANISVFENHDSNEDQRVILFTHGTDISGQLGGMASGSKVIDLAKAKAEKEDCRSKCPALKWLGDPKAVGLAIGLLSLGARTAATLTFGPGGGFAASFFLDSVFFPIYLEGPCNTCVDTEIGYFIHIFIPKKYREKKSTDPLVSMAQNFEMDVAELLKNIDANTLARIHELAEKGGVTERRVAQATARVPNIKFAKFSPLGYFHIWVAGTGALVPDEYLTEGRTVLSDGNVSLVLDYEKGELAFYDRIGRKIWALHKPDHVRLSRIDNRIPATVLPQRITRYKLSGAHAEILEIRNGAIFMKGSLRDCFSQGVEYQTGRPLSSDNLSLVLGRAEHVNTTAGAIEFGDTNSYLLTREDNVPVGGHTVSVYDDGTVVVHSQDMNAGEFLGLVAENGLIVLKEEGGEKYLILWIWEMARAPGEDIKGMTMDLNEVKNPLTNCDEPAFDIHLSPNPDDPASVEAVRNLNNALRKVGPVQILETENKVFYFFSKLEDGVCKKYMRVYDKETGEVKDYEIQDIQQEDGKIVVTDTQGNRHELEPKVENGRPYLYYNGEPDLLRKLVGRGGFLWYDPETGLWHVFNGQPIPMSELFKTNGLSVMAKNGRVDGEASGNNFIFQLPASSGGIGVPVLPAFLLFLLVPLFVLLKRRGSAWLS